MVLFLILLTTSVIATGPPASLVERLLSPPERSRIFSTAKTLSFDTWRAKSFSTCSYFPTKTTVSGLFHKNFAFKKKKIKSFLWWKNTAAAAAAHTIEVPSKKVFPLQRKKVMIRETMLSLPSLGTTKKFVQFNEQRWKKKKLTSSSSAAALDLLVEKMNKKMSLNDIRELLNRPR